LRGALIVKNALFEAIGLPRAVRNMLRDALTHVERHIDAHKDMVKLLRGDTTHVVAGKVVVPAAYAKFTSWKAMAKADPSALVCLNTVRELLERVLAFPHAVNAAERALLLELLSEKKSGLIDDSKYNKLSQSTLAMTVYDMQRVLAADVTFLGAVSEESLSSARPDRPIVSRLVPSAQSAEEPTMLVSPTAMNSLRPHSQSPMAPLHIAALATGLPLETIGKHATGTIRIASDRVIVLYSAVKRDNDPDRIAAHEAHEETVKEHYAETVNSASEWTEFMWVQLGTSAFNRTRPAVVSMADLVARLAGGANDNGKLLKLNLTRERGARRDELSAAAHMKIDSPIKVARLLREQRGCDSYDVGFCRSRRRRRLLAAGARVVASRSQRDGRGAQPHQAVQAGGARSRHVPQRQGARSDSPLAPRLLGAGALCPLDQEGCAAGALRRRRLFARLRAAAAPAAAHGRVGGAAGRVPLEQVLRHAPLRAARLCRDAGERRVRQVHGLPRRRQEQVAVALHQAGD
jgi:hypothetical protein